MNRADGTHRRSSPRPAIGWRPVLLAALGLVVAMVAACSRAEPGASPVAESRDASPVYKDAVKDKTVSADKDKVEVKDKDKTVTVDKDRTVVWGKDKVAFERPLAAPAPPPVAPKNEPDKGLSTESSARVVENPFLAAGRDPLSTFAVSVDTASYSNIRRFLLDDKSKPPVDAVRVAELVNYFTYAYPQPTEADPVSITLDLAMCPWDAAHHLARIGVQARKTDPADMPPRNFVFLVDTSGSMFEPLRLPLFQKGLNMLTDRLTARDRVAIVTYAGSAFVALPSTRGDQKERIHHAIDLLSAGGSTGGGAGIQTAYQVAQANFIQGGVNRVILGTDGDFNVGVTGEALIRLVESKRKDGVFLTVLGFGKNNLKDDEMEQLSYRGNGHYAYVDGENELRKVFVEQGAALQAVAKDVKMQVEFNPHRVGAYRLIGYENRLLRDQDFNDDAKQGGAMGAGHTVTALYEIVPAGLPLPVPGVDPLKYQKTAAPSGAADDGEWLTVKMRYKDPESDVSKVLSRALSGSTRKLADAPADFRFAAATVEFGQLLRGSEYKGDATYAAARALAKDSLGTPPDSRRAEFLLLIDAAERLSVRRGGEERKP